MVGVESDTDQIAQTIIIPVPDKTVHLIGTASLQYTPI